MPDKTVTFDRPIPATLHVHLENGDTFPASPDTMRHFGYVDKDEVFGLFYRGLIEIFRAADLFDDAHHDLSDCEVNPLFYLATTAIQYPPEFFTHREMADTHADIVTMEKALRAFPDIVNAVIGFAQVTDDEPMADMKNQVRDALIALRAVLTDDVVRISTDLEAG